MSNVHAYTRFEIGCSENSTQKLLTKYSTEEKNKNIICRPRSVRIGENCALGLELGPRPAALGRAQDLWHSFSQYGPPGRPITYTYANQSRFDETRRACWSRLIFSMCAWLSYRANWVWQRVAFAVRSSFQTIL